LGQLKSAAVSLDEPCADILLERAHLLGDRGLGHVQFVCRADERQAARDDFEGAQRVERRQAVERAQRLVFLYDWPKTNDLLRSPLAIYVTAETAQAARLMVKDQ
jgi:hypothetical protein